MTYCTGGRPCKASISHSLLKAVAGPPMGQARLENRPEHAAGLHSTGASLPTPHTSSHGRPYILFGVLGWFWIYKLSRHAHCNGWRPLRTAQSCPASHVSYIMAWPPIPHGMRPSVRRCLTCQRQQSHQTTLLPHGYICVEPVANHGCL